LPYQLVSQHTQPLLSTNLPPTMPWAIAGSYVRSPYPRGEDRNRRGCERQGSMNSVWRAVQRRCFRVTAQSAIKDSQAPSARSSRDAAGSFAMTGRPRDHGGRSYTGFPGVARAARETYSIPIALTPSHSRHAAIFFGRWSIKARGRWVGQAMVRPRQVYPHNACPGPRGDGVNRRVFV